MVQATLPFSQLVRGSDYFLRIIKLARICIVLFIVFGSAWVTALCQANTAPPTGEWGWIAGSATFSPAAVYGTQGVAGAGNTPGGQDFSTTWKDAAGNFWLFGGGGANAESGGGDTYSNELWRFTPATHLWTWVSGGPNDSHGVNPSVRGQAAGWTDSQGNLWLFGGDYLGNALSDLWEYTSGAGWKQISGDASYNDPGTYVSVGQAGYPAARYGATAWTDANGNGWLYGGQAGKNFCGSGVNDLWEFKNQQWIWMGGQNLAVAGNPNPNCAVFNGNYGTKGIASSSNYPPGRAYASGWTDVGGKLWLFGGASCNATASCSQNDLVELRSGDQRMDLGRRQQYDKCLRGL